MLTADGARVEHMRALAGAASERLRELPLPVVTHGIMLRDASRLAAFRRAIEAEVGPDREVVDIGTGTGILAAYAAAHTSRTVHAIEVEPSMARIARRLFEAAGLQNVRVFEGASFGKPLAAAPQVLITETLGPLGVDEHIVETCREFCVRYPSVETVIPHRLSLSCCPIVSRELVAWGEALLGDFLAASFGSFDYRTVEPELRQALACSLLDRPLPDARRAGADVTFASFQLGKTRSSRFDARFEVPRCADGVLLYFEAELGGGQRISTGLDSAPSHWGQHFLLRPKDAQELRVAYTPGRQVFDCSWS